MDVSRDVIVLVFTVSHFLFCMSKVIVGDSLGVTTTFWGMVSQRIFWNLMDMFLSFTAINKWFIPDYPLLWRWGPRGRRHQESRYQDPIAGTMCWAYVVQVEGDNK